MPLRAAHYLQHVPFEGLGAIGPWLRDAGYRISGTPLHESAHLPEAEEIDFLVVMGGPMSVNDEVEFPWLRDEKRLVRECVERGVPVLGVCLGAQLLASAMGAEVGPAREREIGWFPVRGAPRESESTFPFPASVEVFHWHGETFDLPEGAVRLASSEVCENQAFQLGRTAIGLQFHLEVTASSLREMAPHVDTEPPSPYVQPRARILSAPAATFDVIHRLMADVLSFLQSSR